MQCYTFGRTTQAEQPRSSREKRALLRWSPNWLVISPPHGTQAAAARRECGIGKLARGAEERSEERTREEREEKREARKAGSKRACRQAGRLTGQWRPKRMLR